MNQRKMKRLFVEAIKAGVFLGDALHAGGLKWGHISAWRRWDARFRRAHNAARRSGLPKRQLIHDVDRLLNRTGGRFVPVPSSVKICSNARACMRALARDARKGRPPAPPSDPPETSCLNARVRPIEARRFNKQPGCGHGLFLSEPYPPARITRHTARSIHKGR